MERCCGGRIVEVRLRRVRMKGILVSIPLCLCIELHSAASKRFEALSAYICIAKASLTFNSGEVELYIASKWIVAESGLG